MFVAFFAMATGSAARAAVIDKQTQELLGFPLFQEAPDTSWLMQNPVYPSLLHSRLLVAQSISQPKASVSNGVVYSATSLVDVRQIAMGWATDGSTFACYVNKGFDGTYSLSADGVIGSLISDSQLPGGQILANPTNGNFVQMSCSRDTNNVTTAFFMAVDPNHRLSNGAPFLSLWYADSLGRSGQILSNGSTFTAKDPRTKTDAVFTVTQLSGLEVRKGKATTLVVVTPPQQTPGIPPVPQGMFVRVGTEKSVEVMFNNLKDVNRFWFSNFLAFAQTDTELYVAGQLTDRLPTLTPPAKTSNQILITRIQNGTPVTVKDYFNVAGSVMNAWSNGVQVTSIDRALNYSFLPDNSLPIGTTFQTGEVQFFSGAVIDGVTLSSRDTQIPTGPKDLYIMSVTGSLLQINNGQARLIHSPQMSPNGNARGIAISGNQTVYVQNEGSVNRTYLMYILPTTLPLIQALPGDTVIIDGSRLIIDNKLPSFTLLIGGRQVAYGATSSGKITIEIPSFALPGSYTGTFDVQGVKVAQPIDVQTPGQAAPVVTSILNGANFQPNALVSREHVTIFLTKAATGTQAFFTNYPTYELGGMSAQFEGTPMPLMFNSGSGQINAVLPKVAASKSQGNVTVSIKHANGNVVSSLPFQVGIGPVDDSFFQFPDTDGKTLPIVTHVNGNLVTKANPATAGETVIGYGTGCAPDPDKLPEDNQVNPTTIPSAVTPSLLVGGQPIQVTFAGLVQDFVGLCQYNFVIPPMAESGDVSMQFSGTAYTYTLRVN